ncbi:MAG: AMP-binding protein [Candidatus Yanofskybacteria bacterium]|nr:AMP-binding protein [Candidatus Yanofskybacteria bacterium]
MDIVKVFFETEKKLKILGHKEPALVFIKENGQKVSYSWGEYRRQALYAASAISGKENFIGIISLNLPESFFALLGIILAGATPVPINHFLLKNARGREELKLILSNCKPKIVLANRGIVEESAKNKVNINGIREPEFFTIEEFLETGKRIFEKKLNGRFYCKEKKGGDLLIMPCTSGSSGNPKGVMLSHENIIDRAEAVTKELNVGPEDRILSYLPMGHISELIASFFGQITAGYTVYFTEYSRDREELKKHFPKVLKEVRPTVFLAVPKVWKNLRAGVEKKTKSLKIWLLRKILPDADSFIRRKVKEGLGFSQTKVFVSAASYLNPKDMEFFAGLDIKIRDIYGQTEVAGPLLIDGKPNAKSKS